MERRGSASRRVRVRSMMDLPTPSRLHKAALCVRDALDYKRPLLHRLSPFLLDLYDIQRHHLYRVMVRSRTSPARPSRTDIPRRTDSRCRHRAFSLHPAGAAVPRQAIPGVARVPHRHPPGQHHRLRRRPRHHRVHAMAPVAANPGKRWPRCGHLHRRRRALHDADPPVPVRSVPSSGIAARP